VIREYDVPVPRLRVLQDLDSGECYIGEWHPTLQEEGSFRFVLWDGLYHNEELAREIIKETLYD
jgi:hypothetical protein